MTGRVGPGPPPPVPPHVLSQGCRMRLRWGLLAPRGSPAASACRTTPPWGSCVMRSLRLWRDLLRRPPVRDVVRLTPQGSSPKRAKNGQGGPKVNESALIKPKNDQITRSAPPPKTTREWPNAAMMVKKSPASPCILNHFSSPKQFQGRPALPSIAFHLRLCLIGSC